MRGWIAELGIVVFVGVVSAIGFDLVGPATAIVAWLGVMMAWMYRIERKVDAGLEAAAASAKLHAAMARPTAVPAGATVFTKPTAARSALTRTPTSP